MLNLRWLGLLLLSAATGNGFLSSTGRIVPASAVLLGAQPLPSPWLQPARPSGWRRTTRGWERAEGWALPEASAGEPAAADDAIYGRPVSRPQSIDDWIDQGRRQELTWARSARHTVRSFHPLALAGLLIGAAIAIAGLSERRSKQDPGAS